MAIMTDAGKKAFWNFNEWLIAEKETKGQNMNDETEKSIQNEIDEWKCLRARIEMEWKSQNEKVDELIARHQATLDLLAKPAQPEPAQECGCIDKAKLLSQLKFYTETSNDVITRALEEEDFAKAARYKAALDRHQHLEGMILRGKFDRAPCKPEPAPCDKCGSGVVLAISDKGTATIRLQSGRIVDWRCDVSREDIKPEPAPSKPALDKGDLLKTIKAWAEDETARPSERKGYRLVTHLIEAGTYDLPATATPSIVPSHISTASTTHLVEQLRTRASLADGIDITELDAHVGFTFRGDTPATVIVVMKEDRS